MSNKPTLPQHLRETLSELLQIEGIVTMSKRMKVSRQTIASLAAGLPVQRSTLFVAEKFLTEKL